MLRRLAACVGAALLLGGCTTYGANVSVLRPDPAPAFTPQEQEMAKAIALRVGRAAGFWETDAALRLAAHPTASPYRSFVSLGAPGGPPERRSVRILGEMRDDRRELRLTVGDDARGEPLPATRALIEDLRAALERAFPDGRVEVTQRRKLHLLAP